MGWDRQCKKFSERTGSRRRHTPRQNYVFYVYPMPEAPMTMCTGTRCIDICAAPDEVAGNDAHRGRTGNEISVSIVLWRYKIVGAGL